MQTAALAEFSDKEAASVIILTLAAGPINSAGSKSFLSA